MTGYEGRKCSGASDKRAGTANFKYVKFLGGVGEGECGCCPSGMRLLLSVENL